MGHRFDPAHVERLLSEERRKMLPPEPLVDELGIQDAHVVADIGCGPGYFTIPLANRTRATVYGVDVSPEMIAYLMAAAERQGVRNIVGLESAAEQIPLPDASVDRIFCSFVLHEVDDLPKTLQEFARILRPGGKMLLLEWEKADTGFGPPVAERLAADVLWAQVSALRWQGRRLQPNPQQYGFLIETGGQS